VARLKDLAMGLLDLGRPAAIVIAPVDPDAPAREVAALIQSKAAEVGARLELALTAGPRPFALDAEAVRHCLLNLALNALEACRDAGLPPGQGRVLLSSRRQPLAQGGAALVYHVEDNGPGFPQGMEAAPCFHSRKRDGSGIGLFATRKTAHEMGADLRLHAGTSGGAVAELWLWAKKR
jgi:signal transduction histidine kinase